MPLRVAVFTLFGMVLLAAPLGRGDAATEGVEEVTVSRVPYDFVTRLEIDWLDDEVEVPQAFNVNSGTMPVTGDARFRVFAMTDDPRYYYDVTSDFQPLRVPPPLGGMFRRPPKLRIDTHGLRKGRGVTPEFRYDVEQKAIVYRPRFNTVFDRGVTGTLNFRWQLPSPRVTYTTRFVLAIPPRFGP